MFQRIAALAVLLAPSALAFTPTHVQITARNVHSAAALQMSAAPQNLVIISPPGGIGEVAAVEAAKKNASVRWFVISPPSKTGAPTSTVTLSSQTLESIDGLGELQLAGAQADTLLLPTDDPASALSAVSTWCKDAQGVICVVDGIEEAVATAARMPGANPQEMEPKELRKMNNIMMDAIKVASSEASSSSVMKIAVLPAAMDLSSLKKGQEEEEEEDGKGFLSTLFAGNNVEVPGTLSKAMTSGGSSNFATLRYGELFGIPESSPDASPLVGGPRRYPVLRDEYTMRSVRIDPILSISGNAMLTGGETRSSRLSVGEAAVRMAMKTLNIDDGTDVCLTSLRGTDVPDDDEWADEFDRVQQMLSSGKGAQLFSASFGSVPSIDRLSEWVATKWAPAVMKTYDIAGIRVGARPVYASVVGEGKTEIVWQNIVDFKTILVGKMIIEISDTGITATRAGGDASAGYGSISSSPLPGEDILVRRLAEAATQAMEKGLATKPQPKKRIKKEVAEAPVISTVVSAGSVAQTAPEPAAPAASETGPRTAGARRSSERARGKRRRKSAEKKTDEKSGSWE